MDPPFPSRSSKEISIHTTPHVSISGNDDGERSHARHVRSGRRTTMDVGEKEETKEEREFDALGLDPKLLQAMQKKKGIRGPTHVQRAVVPAARMGKDVLVRADTGSGKTLAYLLPMVHKLMREGDRKGWKALVLVPTRELCKQVADEALWIANRCGNAFGVTNLASKGKSAATKAALATVEDLVVSTPATVADCVRKGVLPTQVLQERLQTLVLDEADLLLTYGYGEDLQTVTKNVPRSCQCMLISATLNDDVEQLKELVLHNPQVIDVHPEKAKKAGRTGVAETVEHFKVECQGKDKLLCVAVALKMGLVAKKTLVFVNTINTGYKVKLFLESFGVRSAVLNAELPLNSRQHILQEFNKGLFDHLIATDSTPGKSNGNGKGNNGTTPKRKRGAQDGEYGVVRGIDFRGVRTVLNFDIPEDINSYIHRAGRTGRAGKTGACVTLCAEDETAFMETVDQHLRGDQEERRIKPLEGLTKSQVEAFRYRGEDVARRITRNAIKEARAKEIRMELLNSERLQSHFEDNPKDLALLKHDKTLQKSPGLTHLKNVPNYMRDSKTLAAVSDLSKKRKLESSSRRATRQDSKKAATFLPASKLGQSKEDDELTPMEKSVFGSKLWSNRKLIRKRGNVRKNKRRSR